MSGPSVVVVAGGAAGSDGGTGDGGTGDGSARAPVDAVKAALADAGGAVIERVAADRVDGDGGETGVGETATADADAVFAVGDEALLAFAAVDVACPVFPIATGSHRYSIPAADVAAAVDALDAERYETVSHPVLDVAVDGERAGAAVADVTLMTTEPARISEYGVGSPDDWRDTVRADGVVAATPLGSAGYARDAGGPILAPETGLVAVPVSPYAMHATSWVLQPPVTLSVEREEAAVSLLLDDAVARQVPAETPIDVRVGRELPLVRPQTIPVR
ncbi:MAG: NAD(+)/NADH kinase [Haloquadratum sp.]